MIGRGLCYVAFLALLALRRPVRVLLRVTTGLGTLAAVILLIGAEGMRGMAIGAGCVAFAAFAFGWFYDQLLLRLSPRPLFLAQ
jgi:hypothetical protein